jgi:hypothetical protein
LARASVELHALASLDCGFVCGAGFFAFAFGALLGCATAGVCAVFRRAVDVDYGRVTAGVGDFDGLPLAV